MSSKDIFIVVNPEKPQATEAVEQITKAIGKKSRVVGTVMGARSPELHSLQADYVIVLGGDGTILAVARAIGQQAIPIIGVNVGKLGFLAEFSVEEFIQKFDEVFTDTNLIVSRMMLEVSVHRSNGGEQVGYLAVNDVCAIAGPPFRMIELEVCINGRQLALMSGDGLILSTPTGSTAYNMSVGGPIILPRVRAIVISPIAPHSLSFRPMVVDSDSSIEIRMSKVNEGTTLLVDGQLSTSLVQGDVIRLHRYEKDFKLVRNPKYPPWHTLVAKLGWGLNPNYNSISH